MPVSLDETFAFFADAYNLEAITPPWLRFRIVSAPDALEEGSRIDYRLSLHGVGFSWRTRIEVWERPRRFVDRQLDGPFALWEHTHAFEARDGGTLIRDVVRYRMPFAAAGELAHRLLIGRDLERIFGYRREAVARQLAPRATLPAASS